MKKLFVMLCGGAMVLGLCACSALCPHENTQIIHQRAASCTETGFTGDVHCLDCDEVIQRGEILGEAGGHKPILQGVAAATCTEAGSTGTESCEVCGTVLREAEVLPAMGHVEVLVDVITPTCQSGGYSGNLLCETCGEQLAVGQELPPENHVKAAQDFKAASCLEEGYMGDVLCTLCGELLEAGRQIPKTAHDIFVKDRVPATCTTAGYSGDEICRVCQTMVSKGKELPQTGHQLAKKNEKPVSCGVDGYSGDTYCVDCKLEISKGSVIPSQGHGQLSIRDAIAATREREGYSGDLYCTVCNEKLEAGTAVPKVPNVGEIASIGELEQDILSRMNEARTQAGMGTLVFDTELRPGTTLRANEYRYWSNEGGHNGDPHHRPNGEGYYAVFAEVGVGRNSSSGIGAYPSHGEILAASSSGSEGLFRAWMNSPGHKGAILTAYYTHVSISVIEVNHMYYSCAIFHDTW